MFFPAKGRKAAFLALMLACAAFAVADTKLSGKTAMAQGTPGESAEIAFWNSIKDSRNVAEYQAYLQAFPSGVFAPLARLRVQQLGGGGGTAAGQALQPGQATPQQQPPAPQQPAGRMPGGVDMGNAQIVSEIQTKLYNLNYDIVRFDGVPDDQTRQAIREWQERVRVPVTGELSEDLFQRLRTSRAPALWGSIAYTANGTIGRAWSRPSRKDAEETAMAECRRRAGRNADCSIQSAGDLACLAVATYRSTVGETVYYGARVSLKPQLQPAIAAAMEQCQAAERSNGTCSDRISFCADGSHEK